LKEVIKTEKSQSAQTEVIPAQ